MGVVVLISSGVGGAELVYSARVASHHIEKMRRKLCQSDKSMTGFTPSLKIQVYEDHIVCKVVINLS